MHVTRTSIPSILKLMAHKVRWNLLQLLVESDYRIQDLVMLLHLPQNLVSCHLRLLREWQMITERRSNADEQSSYYRVDLEHFHTLYQAAAADLHSSLAHGLPGKLQPEATPPTSPVRILFLCTENSARSQMAEALLRRHSHGALEVVSAGSLPANHIHPLAVKVMTSLGMDIGHQYPKYLEAFRGERFDYVVTLCNHLKETCPTFPGDPKRIHWSFADPTLVEGPEEVRYRAFEQTVLQLSLRLRLWLTILRYHRGLNV